MTVPASPASPEVLDRVRVLAGRNAVGWVFGINGFFFASWVARLPAVRDELGVTPGELGLVLLALSVGSVGALPLSGFVVHRLGPARTVLAGAVLVALALAVAGVAPGVVVLMASLLVYGAGTGTWDVAMNVEAAAVEQRLGRAIMSRFHAGFSLGTVAGAAVGAVAAAAGVPVAVHFAVVAAVGLAVVVVCVRAFLPVAEPASAAADRTVDGAVDGAADGRGAEVAPAPRGSGVLGAWRERRTLAIGLFVLGMAFAEGSANDWLAIGLVDGYGVGHAVGAIGFGIFVTAMTLARLAGPVLLERYGRVAALRSSAVLVLAGVALVVAGAWLREPAGQGLALALATVGALAWGAGAALGFPVGMSAAADEPLRAAARVSVVSTIGYTAFIAGPPLLGLLGDRVGVINAMLGVSAAVAVSLLTVGSVRPPAPSRVLPAPSSAPPLQAPATAGTGSGEPTAARVGDRGA